MPGAGKSYICPLVEKELRELRSDATFLSATVGRRGRTSRRLRKLWSIPIAVALDPGFCMRVLSFVRRSRPVSLRWHLLLTMNWIYVYHSISRSLARDNVAILDQALFQALWSTYYFATVDVKEDVATGFLSGVLDDLHLDHHLVFIVNCDAETLTQRLKARRFDGSPLESADEADFNRAWDITFRVKQVMNDVRKLSRNVSVRELDNGKTAGLEGVCREIKRFLTAPLHSEFRHAEE